MRWKKKFYNNFFLMMEDWIPKEASIAIAIGNRYIYYFADQHDICLQESQTVQSGSLADRIIRQRCKLDMMMNESFLGAPYYGIGYPIDVQGEVAALLVILPPNYPILRSEPFTFLTGKKAEDWSPIPIEEVTCIESMQKKTWFYANDEQYCTSHTLKDLLLRLPKSFMRIHRSYIVNIPYIRHISRDISSNLILSMKDGTELPVSQSYMNTVRKVLGF
ncbi:LytTR family DNA-binding domain-containing protein [Sporosarcina limicola]|uniref:DNA-binding LytR/AlgR family response regulator n=1 Tax=Sporosarcina limicola TaxID=34101 RepID=A0A927MKZ8_9BACL|nr:LytTR family DNA-binding domain-containing protein [Sporosarcina limicola]MBE1556654.1 DNA-binding LytR/AlgR family response regulator [Sporosarcina limicola]